MNEPRPIGFWYGSTQQELPKPQSFARRNWISDLELESLVTYLIGGANHETWRGLSYCLFRCDGDYVDLGCRDFTDGIWLWSEGLFHCIESHDVILTRGIHPALSRHRLEHPDDAVSQLVRPIGVDDSAWIAWRLRTQPKQNKTVLDNRLTAPICNDFRSCNLQSVVEGVPPIAGARPFTIARKMSESAQKNPGSILRRH